jgi:Sensors of blue-light using FAD
MKTLHTICYISNVAPQLDEKDIDQVLTQSSQKNNEASVSGILLYNLGHFFQVLEGEKNHIVNLYENQIKKDKRHQAIFEVYNKTVTSPVFLNYNAQYNLIKTEEDLQKIKDYLISLHTTTSDKLSRLLKPFAIFQEINK